MTPRHRRTLLGLGAGRPAGFYEQCDHRSPGQAIVGFEGTPDGALTALGMVERGGRLLQHVLRSIAGSDHLSDFDARTVSIVDLLSEVRLDAEADLIMWQGADGSRIATPIARLFDDVEAAVLLGGVDQTAPPQWSTPVVLRASSLPDRRELVVVGFVAMTFEQFVGGER